MNIIKNKIKKKIVKMLYKDAVTKGKYPRVGSPECKCKKCMFFEIVCNPRDGVVGCFHGWKMNERG